MAKKIEKLLSVDPIGAFDKIKSNYLRYFRTAYKFKESDNSKYDNFSYLNKRLYGFDDNDGHHPGLIDKDGNLFKEPLCELLPEYESAGSKLEDLISEDKQINWPNHFAEFISRGLMKTSDPNRPYIPYAHQYEMLRLAFGKKKNVVITSGTGSGKTESFLLPLFASLLYEASRWQQQKYDPNWYSKTNADGEYDRPYQRLNEKRPAALRALVLYPMNALVNDQMSRLRQALDCEEIRSFYDDSQYGYNGNRIFFGRYNGETIGAKDQELVGGSSMQKCARELSNIVARSKNISQKIQGNDLDSDAEFVAPRFSDDPNKNKIGSEMLTRWDMQEYPPDVLITNVSMLSIALMRSYEDSIFDKTRDYYDNNPDAVFHLIVDELHLHRGTAGSEVACLLRMFLERIGVPPTIEENGQIKANPRLRILASSASLGVDSEKFLEEFFGVYNEDKTPAFTVIGANADLRVQDQSLEINYNDFESFCTYRDSSGLSYVDEGFSDTEQVKNELAAKYNCSSIKEFVEKYHEQIFFDLKEAVKRVRIDSRGEETVCYVPTSVDQVADNLKCSVDAVRGFFIFRGDKEVNALSNDFKLPRIRFHQFFKYIEGLWGELQNPDTNNGECIGSLMYEPHEIVTNAEGGTHRVLELLRCECCGTLYIGGNRLVEGNQTKALLLNTPDLDTIPNRSATPMVQNKLFKDYAIFLPTDNPPLFLGKYPYVDDGGNARLGNQDDCYACWKECWLSPDDGSISDNRGNNSIHGYLYIFARQRNNGPLTELGFDSVGGLSALPCQCPCCNKNYANRIYTKSPIRSFRTGIKRNNQLLSKELMYQLNDTKQEAKQQRAGQGDYYQTHGKLIGFSDSRQDAAEQSYGIAQEHFRDLVRYFFIKRIEDNFGVGNLNAALANVKNKIIRNIDDSDICLGITKNNIPDDSLREILDGIIVKNIPDDQKIDEINQITVPNSKSYPLFRMVSTDGEKLDGDIVKDLLSIGVNPAAVDYNDQYYGKEELFWDQYYDWLRLVSKDSNSRPAGFESKGVIKRLESYIYNNCFGRYMGLSTEDAGLGYVVAKGAINQAEQKIMTDLQNELNQYGGIAASDFLNAYIRVLGDSHRFKDPDSEMSQKWSYYFHATKYEQCFSTECRSHIASITGDNQAPKLGNILFGALKEFATNEDILLDMNKLSFVMVDDDSPYYKCEKCGRVHLHRGMGLCTNTACREPLPSKPRGKAIDLRRAHFISYDIMTEPREACRIHTEELTGQTDDQTRRLLDFKNVILDDSDSNGNPIVYSHRAKEIDMLSVTTTMEVGVDIGSLQAVYQGNMPPTRYNYQQRVGRGGRRGQAFSAAVTFCRGRSHDSYFYKYALDEITGGQPKDPTLSVNPNNNGRINLAIIKRVILKHVLMYAFADIRNGNPQEYIVDGDTHGQFGLVSNWPTTRSLLGTWIGNNTDKIKTISNVYLKQFGLSDSQCQNDLIAWFNNKLLSQIDSAVNNTNVLGLAQAMAEYGLLPLYGMPTTMRELIHGYNKKGNGYRTIGRSLEQSITEFAPGAIKTKDSGFYRSVGLTVPISSFENKIPADKDNAINVQRNDLDPLEFNRCLTYDANGGDIKDINKRTVDPNNRNEILLVIPKAFRTGIINENTGKLNENTDSRRSYTQSRVFVKEAGNCADVSFANTECKIWNCDDADKTELWHINDNNGRKFEVVRAYRSWNNRTFDPEYYSGEIKVTNVDHSQDLLKYAPQYLDVRFEDIDWNPDNEGSRPRTKKYTWKKANDTQNIVLGANKVTEVLRLSVSNCNPTINLDLNTGNKPAIKSAFFSAATLIQRYFADEIDIEPSEIEISVQSHNGTPVAYLSDALDNGAGFIRMLCSPSDSGKIHLYEIMEDIVSSNPKSKYIKSLYQHKSDCKTACHECLKSYDNQGLHHVLDWRLGMDLIKLMLDPSYRMGWGDLAKTPYGDLEDVMKGIISATLKANNNLTFRKEGNYYIASENVGGFGFVEESYLIHPLWNESQLPALNNTMKRAHNTFQLLRGIYTPTDDDDLTHLIAQTNNTTGIIEDDEDLG